MPIAFVGYSRKSIFLQSVKLTIENTYTANLTALQYTSAYNIHNMVGPDGAVGIATRYELDGPGIESRCGRDFQHPSRPALWPTQPPVDGYRVIPGGKAAGAWR